MTELEALWAAYGEVMRQAKEVQTMMTELGHQIVVAACPFKVGDVLTRTYEHGRWSKNRQERTERARIGRIKFAGWRKDRPYELYGTRIKKDGTDGVEIHLSAFDNWTKEDQG